MPLSDDDLERIGKQVELARASRKFIEADDRRRRAEGREKLRAFRRANPVEEVRLWLRAGGFCVLALAVYAYVAAMTPPRHVTVDRLPGTGLLDRPLWWVIAVLLNMLSVFLLALAAGMPSGDIKPV